MRISDWSSDVCSSDLDDATSTLWAHTGDGLAAFDQISADGQHITGLHLYRRGVDGQFEVRLKASRADWVEHSWRLSEAPRLQLTAAAVLRMPPDDNLWQTTHRADFSSRDSP